MSVDQDDMAWAIAEATKIQAEPKPKTRPFAEWRAELKAKHAALSPTSPPPEAPPKVRSP